MSIAIVILGVIVTLQAITIWRLLGEMRRRAVHYSESLGTLELMVEDQRALVDTTMSDYIRMIQQRDAEIKRLKAQHRPMVAGSIFYRN